jgi:hypothetical protein
LGGSEKNMSLKKRSREEEKEESSKVDVFEMLASDLLSYVLSFSFRDYVRISRVSHRFRFITRQKGFWRCVGLYGLKNIVPTHILKEVDFFYDLKLEDLPWMWLGCVVSAPSEFYVSVNCYSFKTYHTSTRVMELSWDSQKGYYSQRIVQGDRTSITYFRHPFLRKRVYRVVGNKVIYIYVEIYDPKTQKTWYGEPPPEKEPITWNNMHLLYPNKDCFGIWI